MSALSSWRFCTSACGADLSANTGPSRQTMVSPLLMPAPVYEPGTDAESAVQCSAATNHLITNTVFNISSDLMIILIPMPIFVQSTLTLRKKLILCGVFAVGTFTVRSLLPPERVWKSADLCRSSRLFSTNTIASRPPLASTGPIGTSASPRPPSSPPTYP